MCEFLGIATYSPEDNKLRFYADERLSDSEYKRAKAARFKWAPKQECFVCARWTPSAEDLLLEWCGEIADEDYSAEERSADRAERFSGYRDKRRAEAGCHADRFEAGPQVHGRQSQRSAERAARRHNRQRLTAVSQWSKAEYWQQRTAGVIRHALHKSSACVRRGRILRIEKDQRSNLAAIERAQAIYDAWAKVAAMPGAELLMPLDDSGWVDTEAMNDAQRLAYATANASRIEFRHPASAAANEKCEELHGKGAGFTAFDLLRHDEYRGVSVKRMTPAAYAELYLAEVERPDAATDRWAIHYRLRLSYEKAMLAEEGGAASDADVIPGGFFGKYQVQRVNRSRTTGRVVSVMVYAEDPYFRGDGPAPLKLMKLNIERLAEGDYRSPTEDELQEFKEENAARKARQRASAQENPKPKLLNPTDSDAQRLQMLWNRKAEERWAAYAATKPYSVGEFKDQQEVLRMTQSQYSRLSKISHGGFKTVPICSDGMIQQRRYGTYVDDASTPVVCKIRKIYGNSSTFTAAAHRVIVLTDKPQKPLPIDWAQAEAATEAMAQ